MKKGNGTTSCFKRLFLSFPRIPMFSAKHITPYNFFDTAFTMNFIIPGGMEDNHRMAGWQYSMQSVPIFESLLSVLELERARLRLIRQMFSRCVSFARLRGSSEGESNAGLCLDNCPHKCSSTGIVYQSIEYGFLAVCLCIYNGLQ